jgi:hypothetical protein
MALNTYGRSVHPGSVAVVVALAVGVGGGAATLGFSSMSVSLLGAATTVVGLWAFVSEP